MSTKRSGWHRSKPAVIDDALPAELVMELLPADAVEALEGEYFLRVLAPLGDQSRNETAIVRAREVAMTLAVRSGRSRRSAAASELPAERLSPLTLLTVDL